MGTPICGVLLLDPSPVSPLKLVQRWGADSVCVEGALACDQEEPRQLTSPLARQVPNDLQLFQPARRRM